VGRDVAKEADMSTKSTTRLVREGELEDAYKLDDVREALRVGDVKRASRLSDRVYRLTLVEA